MELLVQVFKMGNAPSASGSGSVTFRQLRGNPGGIQLHVPDDFAQRDVKTQTHLAVQQGLFVGSLGRNKRAGG